MEDTRRDAELLMWVARFRFVTAEALGAWFGISEQRARARVRRLERHGLLGSWRAHVSESKAIWITGKGCALLGRSRRRPPQPTVAREHEAGIVDTVIGLERMWRHRDDVHVLTEREARAAEREALARREARPYSVQVNSADARLRWPDVVVEAPGRRIAVEIEFTPKATPRLEAIVQGYAYSQYSVVMYMVRSPRLAARLDDLMARAAYGASTWREGAPELQIAPWGDLDAAAQAKVRAAAPRHGARS